VSNRGTWREQTVEARRAVFIPGRERTRPTLRSVTVSPTTATHYSRQIAYLAGSGCDGLYPQNRWQGLIYAKLLKAAPTPKDTTPLLRYDLGVVYGKITQRLRRPTVIRRSSALCQSKGQHGSQ
jgi:hypothetical protein